MGIFQTRQALMAASLTSFCIHVGVFYALISWAHSASKPSVWQPLQASIVNSSPTFHQPPPAVEPRARASDLNGGRAKRSPYRAPAMAQPMISGHQSQPSSTEPAAQHLAVEPLQQALESSLSPKHDSIESTDPMAHPEAFEQPFLSARYQASHLNNPKASYPMMSRRLGEEGRVLLRVLVSARGAPERIELQVSSGFPRLDQAAIDAVSRWNFDPARRAEVAIADWVSIPVVFRLNP